MMKHKVTVFLCIISMAIGVLVTKSFYEKNINTDKTVIKEKIVTKIIEHKDGTKETIITEDKTTKETSKTAKINNYSVAGSTSLTETIPVYTVYADLRVLADIFVGGYVRSDKEAGVLLRYSF